MSSDADDYIVAMSSRMRKSRRLTAAPPPTAPSRHLKRVKSDNALPRILEPPVESPRKSPLIPTVLKKAKSPRQVQSESSQDKKSRRRDSTQKIVQESIPAPVQKSVQVGMSNEDMEAETEGYVLVDKKEYENLEPDTQIKYMSSKRRDKITATRVVRINKNKNGHLTIYHKIKPNFQTSYIQTRNIYRLWTHETDAMINRQLIDDLAEFLMLKFQLGKEWQTFLDNKYKGTSARM